MAFPRRAWERAIFADIGRSRYKIFEESYPYFLTSSVVGWLPIFIRPAVANIVLDSLTFLTESERIELYAYVVMENHIHLIASSDNLIKEIGDLKSFTARSIIDYCEEHELHDLLKSFHHLRKEHKQDRPYQIWQEGSHPEQVVNTGMLRQQVDYIHNNPVRRGYVDLPAQWRYSRARNYEGKEGLVKVTTEWY